MDKEVIIVNPKEFERKKKAMKEGGIEKFHVVSDFDRTLTYGVVGGERTETVISKIRSDSKYLGEEYVRKAKELFSIYHPIEINPDLPVGEKIVKMHEWWKKHFELLAERGFSKELIEKVVQEKPLSFRKGAKKFIDCLDEKDIPLVILSAAPGDMIVVYLEKLEMLDSNVEVISNRFEFDESGKALKIKEPIIHTYNKEEVSLAGHPIYEKIKSKTNVLLLGDSLGDVGMAEGFPYENIIKVGFLNEKIEDLTDDYKGIYDVVLTGDQDFDFVNDFIKDILE